LSSSGLEPIDAFAVVTEAITDAVSSTLSWIPTDTADASADYEHVVQIARRMDPAKATTTT
jgi:hypothetical protein